MSTLLSIKTGACPEDCAYCPQSIRYDTGLAREDCWPVAAVRRRRPPRAKAAGATRFCMGAAWRSPKKKDIERSRDDPRGARARPRDLRDARHADAGAGRRAARRGPRLLQPQRRHLARVLRKIISTRTYQDRLDTLEAVREAGLKVCCGGIVGMGETRATAPACW
jgi:biotin synthase